MDISVLLANSSVLCSLDQFSASDVDQTIVQFFSNATTLRSTARTFTRRGRLILQNVKMSRISAYEVVFGTGPYFTSGNYMGFTLTVSTYAITSWPGPFFRIAN